MPLDINSNIISSSDITSAGIFKTSIPKDGMVLHLDAGDVDSYAGSGATTWYDLSGNANNFLINASAYNSSGGREPGLRGAFGCVNEIDSECVYYGNKWVVFKATSSACL